MALPSDSDLATPSATTDGQKSCSDIAPIKRGRPKKPITADTTNDSYSGNSDSDTPTFTGVIFSDKELLRLGKAQAARMAKQAKILEFQKTLVKRKPARRPIKNKVRPLQYRD